METDFLTLEEYQRMGLKCGLEVHQQLKTRHKLFCRCPNRAYTNRYDSEILRHMRPTLSEMGEYDRTALMEFRTRKEIIYRLNRERVCTYEMDDAPPFELNREALDIAIEIAMLFRCNIVGEIHIARKQYLDGSIPTGFQRTMIVGLDGWFPLGDRRIRVRQLSLEEDACREISDVGHLRTYYTDRLCVPLIEVVTEPDFRTPQEAMAGAEVIRRLTRATGKVRRGAGSTRQDTNVSVSGGDRVEIKGVPATCLIPSLVHWEGIRQRALLGLAAEMRSRGLSREDFGNCWTEVTPLLQMSNFGPLRQAVKAGGIVYAVRLPRFKGLLRRSLGRSRLFLDEIKDRVRVVACIDSEPNLLDSEDPHPAISTRIWQRVGAALKAAPEDTLVVIFGPKRDVITACEEVTWRCRDALEAVLPDTRQVRADGTTRFERVLAGPNRMYPDTDMPPVAIEAAHLERIAARCPAFPWERYELLRNTYGLPHDAADALILDGRADLYLKAVQELGAHPRFVSHILTNGFQRLRRRWEDPGKLPPELLLAFFAAHAAGRFTREVAFGVLLRLARAPEAGLEAALAGVQVRRELSEAQLDELVAPALAEQRDLLLARPREVALRIAMGLVMPTRAGLMPGAAFLAAVGRWLDSEEVKS